MNVTGIDLNNSWHSLVSKKYFISDAPNACTKSSNWSSSGFIKSLLGVAILITQPDSILIPSAILPLLNRFARFFIALIELSMDSAFLYHLFSRINSNSELIYLKVQKDFVLPLYIPLMGSGLFIIMLVSKISIRDGWTCLTNIATFSRLKIPGILHLC
jgi:hypothetical protein